MFHESWVTTTRLFGSPSPVPPELSELPHAASRVRASTELRTIEQ
jgi:hypothetical protein